MFMTVALALACGPGAPGETTAEPESTSGSTTAPEPTATGTTGTTGATTGAPATTGEPATTAATSTGATTTAATTDASSTGPPADSGQCIADPAAGICSESCDYWNDCCQCAGRTIAITDPQECKIAVGIVTATCPWRVWNLFVDDQWLAQGSSCDEPETQWTQSELDGDVVIDLCGDTCAAYLDGKFAELEIGMFCEVA